MTEYHISVLLHETIENLQVQTDYLYIDATLGGAGHTKEILKKGGEVLGIDADWDALDYVKQTCAEYLENGNLKIAQGNFKDIDILAKENRFTKVHGILFDLGISSHQVDDGSRGFSFQKEASLDMRMDQKLSVKAADLVNGLTAFELKELFEKLGEEIFAKRIADGIVKARLNKPIETTTQLAQIAKMSYPKGMNKVSPATKIFQALRIAVNDELYSIKEALPKAIELLEKNGRLCVISFHSLEDRIVKELFEELETKGKGKIITHKPIVPTQNEVFENPRSRSAKLRVIEKI